MVTRRKFVAGSIALLAQPAFSSVSIVDVLGNPIVLNTHPKRIILLDATDILTMAALMENPEDLVVGWASADRLDLGDKALFFKKEIPEVGKLSPDTLSIESIIALQPDLLVASAYMLPPEQSASLVQKLAQFSIPVAWTSGHENALSPQESLVKSVSFWGAILGKKARADNIIGLGLSRFEAVRKCTYQQQNPRVFMEIMTMFDDCCWSAGRAFWGPLFDLVGGDLIAGSDGWGAKLSKEGLIFKDPEVFIATGSRFAPNMQPEIGPGLTRPEQSYQSLKRAASRDALRGTTAIQNNKIYAIWSGLATSPMLVPILAECLAQWLHPKACNALSPKQTLQAINKFYAKPLEGYLWLSLSDFNAL